MKGYDSDIRVTRSLFSPWHYLFFFLVISFVVSCCFLLFFAGLDLPEAVISRSAPMTFANVVFLSALFCLVDGIRRKFTVERPVKRILKAARRITKGDFKTRIQPIHGPNSRNEFDIIIENLNQMAKELSGIETLRTDFIANVSHELKTPLAVIQNYSTMLQTPALPEEKRMEYAKTLTLASRRLSDLITNILKLNKLENQRIFPETQKYNLGEQLRECLLGFENTWEKKTLEIGIDIEEDIAVEADAELLTLVWNNLFSNAVKFTEPGGKVSVSLTAEENWAVVKVSDTGCGISPEVGKHIFEKFYQGDKSHAMQGNGLGLALVKRVIDIVDGEILVESEPGKGSTFLVRLRRGTEDAI
ncbi:MAG: HAMP domain-containing sensor histidine kinase [Paenibacillus macerans]|uniref:HAMP domain-containing sensor histidine kinase n=1 Tax=Paenibacillus macerans TaxID=44252 RepID=UPI002910898F|nr:HAMP domain-containing sensor histidine kinase [Paenibacillus macerans]MDU7474619.1 HAMP domain-containing sensor histidine kinase [Paenibacillus macerans]